MKKSFSLMEVIIATALLAVVMVSLYKVQGNSIFLLEKSNESRKSIDFLSLAMDAKTYSKRNKNIFLDKYFNIQNDDIRKEFKGIKIKIEDEIIGHDENRFENITIRRNYYKTFYSFEKGIKKTIYKFEIEL
ncbi:type IV pilus modification PilV family protein [Campylobacterota bacterium DY0563]